MLFALRYESNQADIDRLHRKLAQRGVLEQRRKVRSETTYIVAGVVCKTTSELVRREHVSFENG